MAKPVKIIEYNDEYKSSTKEFILGILDGEFGLGSTKRPDLDDIRGFYQKNKGNFWIALEGGEVVGSVAIKDYGKGRAYLKRMYVSREQRGTGLAKKLLDTALEHARGAGFREVFLGTGPEMVAANRFYSKSGFKRISKLPEGLPGFGDTVFYKAEL